MLCSLHLFLRGVALPRVRENPCPWLASALQSCRLTCSSSSSATGPRRSCQKTADSEKKHPLPESRSPSPFQATEGSLRCPMCTCWGAATCSHTCGPVRVPQCLLAPDAPPVQGSSQSGASQSRWLFPRRYREGSSGRNHISSSSEACLC